MIKQTLRRFIISAILKLVAKRHSQKRGSWMNFVEKKRYFAEGSGICI